MASVRAEKLAKYMSEAGEQVTVLTSMCDHTSRLGIFNTLCAVMDLATEHGSSIGLGADRLYENGNRLGLALVLEINKKSKPHTASVATKTPAAVSVVPRPLPDEP